MKYYEVKEGCIWLHPGGGVVAKAGEVAAMDVDSVHKHTRRAACGIVRRGGDNIFEVDGPASAMVTKKKASKKKASKKVSVKKEPVDPEGGEYKTREMTAED